MLEMARIRVNQYLVGQKAAAKYDGMLHVSPAMFDLMIHATPDELQALLSSIGVIDMDEKEAVLIIRDKTTRQGL